MVSLIRWIQRSREPQSRRWCYTAILAALVYWLWDCRNKKVLTQECVRVEDIVNRVKWGVKERISFLGCKKIDKEYIENVLSGI